MLKIGTFLTDPGVAVGLFTITSYSGTGALKHTQTHSAAPPPPPPRHECASAFNLYDISLTRMTYRLQITKLTKGFYFFLCPEVLNPKCVFFFLFFPERAQTERTAIFNNIDNLQNLRFFYSVHCILTVYTNDMAHAMRIPRVFLQCL